MYYGVRIRMDSKQMWLDGMKDWDGELPERMTNDEQEEAFWREMMEKKRGATDDSMEALRLALLRYLEPTDHVLEIGPGWGNYSFAAAEKAASLTCLDSSRSVLDFLREESSRRNLRVTRFVHAKWEEFRPEEPFDVVFGINCYYRMRKIDQALIRMNNAAKRLAIVGLTSGPEKPHLWEIHRQLGCRIKFKRKDYIYLMNLLYELGIDANCQIVELERVYRYETEEQLIRDNLRPIMDENYDRKAAVDILLRYVTRHKGEYIYPHRFKAALLYWKPEPIDEWRSSGLSPLD
ncbi:class I SAM-dependent methyltransferase [Cohnella zeiphila]|uniref:Class I SAM-dependent methyltransferase n=1 Tax=Cohnella zeiphila TaxID=2761120 RepID=A0A7X0VW77_9BACL|nr:class I SAM-dependent methyltransferase [Cohnella zeiphila]MBB6732127.1 class I SAM-dependent methyltransferase [Cohnella zeiphila]